MPKAPADPHLLPGANRRPYHQDFAPGATPVMDTAMATPVGSGSAPQPTFAEALGVWGRIGITSFGGPAGQIALMHRTLVDEKKWIDEQRYLSALNFCMLLPGPEAMQLATYVGWRLHGLKGGLAAGLLFVLPGALVVLTLSVLYAAFGKLPLAEAVFVGVKAAVLAIVIEALLRVARRALKGNVEWLIAGAAFVAIFSLKVPFPLIVAAAALVGFWRRLAGDRPACGRRSGRRVDDCRRCARRRAGSPSGSCRCSSSPRRSAEATCWPRSAGSSPSSRW